MIHCSPLTTVTPHHIHIYSAFPEQQGNHRLEGKRASRCALLTHELDEEVTRLIPALFQLEFGA